MKIFLIAIALQFHCLFSIAQTVNKSAFVQNLGEGLQLNSLLITNNELYIGNLKGELLNYKIKKDIFKLHQVFNLKSTIIGKPIIMDNCILVSGDYKLFCFRQDGSLKWQQTFARLIKSNILFYNNKIFVDSRDKGIFCLDAANGNVIWQYKSNEGSIGGMLIIQDHLI